MEWSEDLVRVLNRIGDELGRIRKIIERKEGGSKGEESVEERERKDDGERSESGSKTEERSINGEELWKEVKRGEERRLGEEADEMEKTRRLREKVKRMEEEREEKEKKRRNVIWRGLDGRDAEERRGFMERVTEKVMGRTPRIRRVWERTGVEGKVVVLVEMEDEKERAELLEKYWEFRQRWGIVVDEDLTIKERWTKRRILEKARVERERGRRVMTDNRRIWVEGKEILWNEEEGKWEER
ncbi:uncharacterized protein [Temnothorax longispinosus]|uniref:uncharacterized protein isoform X1 n=1 Tax=Temnothorax longispinosus TaxID=300112 RepID=UPI003A98D7C9